jgi:hypothetical protein
MQVSDQYWAGFFDGEGCVSPAKYFSKIHNEKFIVGMRAVVVQKEPRVLYLLQKQYGGQVTIRKNGIGQWQCGKALEVLAFFKAIGPHLIIKSTEVMIALELLEFIMKPRGTNFEIDEQGRKWLTGKESITMEDIKNRQRLERIFTLERADLKQNPIN